MSFDVAAPLVVPDDVVITPVRSLSPELRRQLDGELDDYAITRPRSRTPSRIIDATTAQLLDQFRVGTPIVEAVLSFSRTNGSDPEETLEAAFPALQRLVGDGLLVPAGSDAAHAIETALAPGDHVGDFELLEVVQTLDDSEVYRARSGRGGAVAVKLARSPSSGARRQFRREAAVLKILEVAPAPRLEGDGDLDGRPFIAIEWLDGSDVVTAARAWELADRPVTELALRVADAYAAVHGRGVL